jgi:hypothetical protein
MKSGQAKDWERAGSFLNTNSMSTITPISGGGHPAVDIIDFDYPIGTPFRYA